MEIESDSQDSLISELNEMSSVAKFDDMCRLQPVNDCCDEEFLTFAISQEDCRQKWLATQRELQRTHAQIQQLRKTTSKLELQNHHINLLLKDEIKVRTKIQADNRYLTKKLIDVREYLNCEEGLKVETWERMPFLMSLAQQHRERSSRDCANVMPQSAGNQLPANSNLDAITEVESNCTDERSEEELELSGLVRSYREYNRK